MPEAGRARTSAAFSSRTPSMDPRNSVCWATTMVTTPTVGAASAVRAAISPGWFVPISTTAASCSGPRRRRVSGSPHWLLKLAADLSTAQRVPSTAAISSLVVVLPLEPVTATRGIAKRARCRAAKRPRACVVSSTRTRDTVAGGSSGSACTTRQDAPRPAASITYRCPSC